MAFDVSDFISGLVVHFGQPKFDVSDEDKKKAYFDWLKDMNRNLCGFSGGALEKGAEIIIATRKYRSFPMLFECKEACIDAEEWIKKQRLDLEAKENKEPKNPPQWSPSRFDMADQLIQCSLGRRAAREGWILSLHDFCRAHLRLPKERHVIEDGDPRVSKSKTRDLGRWKRYFIGDAVREIDECVEGARGFDEAYAKWVRGEYSDDLHLTAKYTALGDSMLARRERLRALVLEGVI